MSTLTATDFSASLAFTIRTNLIKGLEQNMSLRCFQLSLGGGAHSLFRLGGPDNFGMHASFYGKRNTLWQDFFQQRRDDVVLADVLQKILSWNEMELQRRHFKCRQERTRHTVQIMGLSRNAPSLSSEVENSIEAISNEGLSLLYYCFTQRQDLLRQWQDVLND